MRNSSQYILLKKLISIDKITRNISKYPRARKRERTQPSMNYLQKLHHVPLNGAYYFFERKYVLTVECVLADCCLLRDQILSGLSTTIVTYVLIRAWKYIFKKYVKKCIKHYDHAFLSSYLAILNKISILSLIISVFNYIYYTVK